MSVAVISFQENTDIIGAKYVHAFLRENGIDCRLILQPHADPGADNAVIDFLAENDVMVVGISIMSIEFNRAVEFSRLFRERLKGVPLIFGGIHPTIDPEGCLQYADAVLVGESEKQMLEIVKRVMSGEDWKDVENLCYMYDGKMVRNPLQELERDLDVFPFPGHNPEGMYVEHRGRVRPMDEKLFRLYSRYDGIFYNIVTTRGCPFSCSYCCNSSFKKLYGVVKIRKRSVESVIDECLGVKNNHRYVRMINIQDDCFMAQSKEWLNEFAKQYAEKIGLPFAFRTTPRHFKPEIVRNLKKAGLRWLLIGLQSGSERVNTEIYNRRIDIQEFLETAKSVKSLGIPVHYDVILDNPYETEEEKLMTLEVLTRIAKPYQLQLFSLTFYQGSELYCRAMEDGIDIEDPTRKDYSKLHDTNINRLMRIAPSYPGDLIRYLAGRRGSVAGKFLIRALQSLNLLIFMPLTYMYFMLKMFDFRIFRTLPVLGSMAKEYFRIFVMKSQVRNS